MYGLIKEAGRQMRNKGLELWAELNGISCGSDCGEMNFTVGTGSCASKKKEKETAQTRLLTAQDERVLSHQHSPILLTEDDRAVDIGSVPGSREF